MQSQKGAEGQENLNFMKPQLHFIFAPSSLWQSAAGVRLDEEEEETQQKSGKSRLWDGVTPRFSL